MIEIKNLTFSYNGAEIPALRDISVSIDDGEFVLITGPSGGGKSSLCRCLNGLIPHFHGGQIRGSVRVEGMNILDHSPKDLAATVGMVFQDPENQLVSMDVEREVAFGLENLGFPRDLIARRVEESLDSIGIADLRERQVHELSGGEKQKVAIASVLALHPQVLVLDEPISELDPNAAEEVLNTVKRLNDELGITVILIEHRLDRVVHFVDRLIVIHEGRVIADGNPRHILSKREFENIGLGIPPIVKLARELNAHGNHIENIPLTVKEGRLMLGSVIKQMRPSVFDRQNLSNTNPYIDVNRLWHSYSDNRASLKGIDLSIGEGEFVAVMGRNASGKTTLAKHCNGLLKPIKGNVLVNGINTKKATTAELSHHVGLAFQNPNDHLFCDTVEDEIVFTLRNLGFKNSECQARTTGMLERFGLLKYRKQYPRSLSGGEKQRVALASIVAANPKILILDEPTRGMEQRLKDELMRFLDEYRKEGASVILISHDVETVAAHADRVVLMSDGKVIVDGSARDVLSNALMFSPQINRLVQSFERYGVPGNIMTVEELLDILR